jgi:hypothetical protein
MRTFLAMRNHIYQGRERNMQARRGEEASQKTSTGS